MKMKQPVSIGYQLINAVIANPMEAVMLSTDESKTSSMVATSSISEVDRVYYTEHNTQDQNIPIVTNITADVSLLEGHSVPEGTLNESYSGLYLTDIETITTDTEDKFFGYAPTRIVYDPNEDVTLSIPSGTSITGISYVTDYEKTDASGNILIPKQDVYIVNTDEESPVTSSGNTMIFSTSFSLLDALDYGVYNNDYDNTLTYEVITDVDGYELQFNPVSGTLHVFDYINLDPSGNAQEIPDDMYTVDSEVEDHKTTTTLQMSGTNPYNDLPVGNSNYFVEYQYLVFQNPKCITTDSSSWHSQRYSSPLFTSVPVNYYGTVVNFDIAKTPSETNLLLRMDPRDLRPGSTVDVVFTYDEVLDEEWDGVSEFTADLSLDSNYLECYPSGINVYSGELNITSVFEPSASGSEISIEPVESGYAPPYTVRIFYKASCTYEGVTAVQSYSSTVGAADPYNYDYIIENGYLIPYSIVPLSDADPDINDYLLKSNASQFDVTTDMDFTGIAYDKDKSCVWMIETNNAVLYKMSTDGAVISKYNIFKERNFYLEDKKSIASGLIDEYNGTVLEYPFISQEIDDSNRSITACVYYKDNLYTVSSSDSEDGIYVIDTYNDREMDVKYDSDDNKNVFFPLPISAASGTVESITDITINKDDNFVIAEGDTVKTLRLAYDYTIIDSSRGASEGIVYYREQYENTDVDGFTSAGQKVKPVVNIWDDHASKLGMKRLPNELNTDLKTRIDNTAKYREGPTKQGLINSISSFFGYNQYNATNKRVYFLTHKPSSMTSVTVDDVVYGEVTIEDYDDAVEGANPSGYIVWKDADDEYTTILELITPAEYTRRSDRLHNGSKIVITYEWLDGDTTRTYTDMSNPHDPYDTRFYGFSEEEDNDIRVVELFDRAAVIDIGLMDENNVPSNQLKSISRIIDGLSPVTWGE
jgi:hypothetical protein